MKPRTCPSQNVDASHKREGTVNGGTKEVETIPKLIGDAAGHGGPAERGGETQRKRHQSMEDLSLQQTTGIELARLLRVRVSRQFLLLPEMQLILPPIESPPTRMITFICPAIHNTYAILFQEAGKSGYSPEDLQVAVAHCGDADPVDWLDENFEGLLETVMTLATKVGREAEEENTVGTLSREEAVGAVRKNRGELWPSVTDCVEGRKTKVMMNDIDDDVSKNDPTAFCK